MAALLAGGIQERSFEAGMEVGMGLLGGADHVCRVESLGALLALEFDGFAFVECLIARVLDGGEVDENVLAAGPLDETVTFRSVEPLNYALLFHSNSSCYGRLSASCFPLKQKKPRFRASGADYGSLIASGRAQKV